MQKRILFIIPIVGVAILFIASAYYIAIFLPQKQKSEIEKSKLELEVKIEQEKTEQARIEQEKQRLEDEKQNKLAEEEKKQAESKEQQQKIASASLKKCLDSADTAYKNKFAELTRIVEKYNNYTDAQDTINLLQNNRNQARNECYK